MMLVYYRIFPDHGLVQSYVFRCFESIEGPAENREQMVKVWGIDPQRRVGNQQIRRCGGISMFLLAWGGKLGARFSCMIGGQNSTDLEMAVKRLKGFSSQRHVHLQVSY